MYGSTRICFDWSNTIGEYHRGLPDALTVIRQGVRGTVRRLKPSCLLSVTIISYQKKRSTDDMKDNNSEAHGIHWYRSNTEQIVNN